MHKTLTSTRGGRKVQSLAALQADHHTNPQAGFSVPRSETGPVISLHRLYKKKKIQQMIEMRMTLVEMKNVTFEKVKKLLAV